MGYLQVVDSLMASGRFETLLSTHEQAWLFAVGRRFLPHVPTVVADADAFDQVGAKIACAETLDAIGVPQPAWRRVLEESDLDMLGFPVWVKASFSTGGRGVRHAKDHHHAVQAWRELRGPDAGDVMIQASAPGTYAQVQGLFDHGRLIAVAASEQLAVGAGGSAAARVSVDHQLAVAALDRLGRHLSWHGGLGLDYLHVRGRPQFIECNPRISEPGNAAAAGVDFPELMMGLANADVPPERCLVARAGVRTRSTLAIALGAAEQRGTRRAILAAAWGAGTGRGPLAASREILTPVLADPPSAIPLVAALSAVLTRPTNVARLAGDTVRTYAVSPAAIDHLRPSPRS